MLDFLIMNFSEIVNKKYEVSQLVTVQRNIIERGQTYFRID